MGIAICQAPILLSSRAALAAPSFDKFFPTLTRRLPHFLCAWPVLVFTLPPMEFGERNQLVFRKPFHPVESPMVQSPLGHKLMDTLTADTQGRCCRRLWHQAALQFGNPPEFLHVLQNTAHTIGLSLCREKTGGNATLCHIPNCGRVHAACQPSSRRGFPAARSHAIIVPKILPRLSSQH